MDMHFRYNLFNAVTNIDVSLARVLRMNTTLEANLRGTALERFCRTAHDFLMR